MERGIKTVINYIVSFAKISSIFAAALFLPKFFMYCAYPRAHEVVKTTTSSLKFGLENISQAALKNFELPNGKKCSVALITNQTGIDQQGNRNIDVLLSRGIDISYIFMPVQGSKKEQLGRNKKDPKTQLPLLAWRDGMKEGTLCNKHIKKADMLLFDMQDSGTRFGYVTTLLEAMEAAAHYEKKIVVLDRPNLLGTSMEGTLGSCALTKNLPNSSIPLRYGMTIGELAHYFNKNVLNQAVSLCVVPMENYKRDGLHHASMLLNNLSPNIPTIDSCHGYSLLGLIGEIAPFDVGLGTDAAFQCLAFPEKYKIPRATWYEAKALLRGFGVDSRFYRYYSPRKKSYCSGLKLCIKDINNFASFSTLLSVVKFFKKEGIKLTLSHEFDAAVGTEKVRKVLDGSLEQADLEMEISAGLRSFFHKAVSSCMYSPLPRIIEI